MSKPRAWTPVETRALQDCAVFQVSRVMSRSPEGELHPFFRIDAPDWIHVIPVTADDEIVMVRQYRHGSRSFTLEIPGGMVDPGETPAAAAARELLEETGYRAARVEALGVMNPNPALFANRLHTFWAPGAERVAEVANEGNEETSVELVPREDLSRLLRSGEIDHALVIAGLQLYALAR